MNNTNHKFSFVGGELLTKMGAWWLVSYSYYQYVDRTHLNWSNVKTKATRRSTYNRSKEYHAYWLNEVLSMERLDVHGNTGNLSSSKIKEMGTKVLSVISKDNGKSEMQVILDKLKSEYDQLQGRNSN